MSKYIFSLSLLQAESTLTKRTASSISQTMNFSRKNILIAKKEKRKIAVNIRILLDYVQFFSISQTLKMEWPIYFKDYLKFFAYLSLVDKIISLDCISEDFDIKFESIYVKSLIVTIAPFLLCFFNFTFFLIFSRKKKYRAIKIIVVIFVICTFFQPSIISQLLEILSCVEIDGLKYLSANLEYECYVEEHMKWVDF